MGHLTTLGSSEPPGAGGTGAWRAQISLLLSLWATCPWNDIACVFLCGLEAHPHSLDVSVFSSLYGGAKAQFSVFGAVFFPHLLMSKEAANLQLRWRT